MPPKWTPAGEMRQPITIQQITTDVVYYGEAVPSASTFATATAKIEQLSGREVFYAQLQVTALATHQVTLRFIAGVTPEMQVIWATNPEGTTRTLKIVDVNDVEGQGFELRLLCVEMK